MQLTSRILTGLTALTLCGVAYATLTPVLPWQEDMLPKPTKHHEMVQAGVGEWTGTITMNMPGEPEPMVSPCTETVTAVGQLWTTSRFEMDFMGTPFSGSSTLGYDPKKEKFVGTWIDSMSTSITVMEGEFDEKKNAMVMHYEMFDQMSQQMKNVRNEYVFEGETYSVTFYDVGEEGDTLTMKMDMKRK